MRVEHMSCIQQVHHCVIPVRTEWVALCHNLAMDELHIAFISGSSHWQFAFAGCLQNPTWTIRHPQAICCRLVVTGVPYV
jgi:hypothetical protein